MRLTSLDVFRGIAIATMLLVNNPGSWEWVYPPFLHAEWHGFTPTDLVFPSFLFIVGVAMTFSLGKYQQGADAPATSVYWRILRRCALLFAIGVGLNASTSILNWLFNGTVPDWSILRIMGVLQRIALAYVIAALAILKLSPKHQWALASALLLAYWGAMVLVPVPGFGSGDLSAEGNLGGFIDRLILTNNHLLNRDIGFDPEGLFSTIPAAVTVLVGYFTGEWLRRQPRVTATSWQLAIFGLSCLVVGRLWGFVFPINKQLWTSSYVLFSAGWALLLLAAIYETIEVRHWRQWGWPFEVMGLNAIFAFVGSGFLARILITYHIGSGDDAPNLKTWIYETLFVSWAGQMNGSLLFAIGTVLLWWLILLWMYRQQWFFKI